MNIDNFQEDIKKCRFCFMCRHLSGVGNVTFREADTQRIRTAMVYGVPLDNSTSSTRFIPPTSRRRAATTASTTLTKTA